MKRLRPGPGILVALLSVAAAPVAHAAGKTGVSAPANDDVSEAAKHFKMGVKLYQEADFPGALIEFRAANALVPNYRILYNLGQVAQEMHDWASALRYYREYLDSGGTAVKGARRKEVEKSISELVPQVGRLTVKLVGASGTISLDGDLAAPAIESEGVTLNPGPHKVAVTFPAHQPELRLVEIVAGDTSALVFERVAQPEKPRPFLTAPRPARPEPPWLLRQRAEVWTWSATALLGAGAIYTAVLARSYSQDLVHERTSIPADQARLEWFQARTEKYALITDGLLAGGTVLGLVSIYLSLRDREARPREADSASGLQIGPGAMAYGWKF